MSIRFNGNVANYLSRTTSPPDYNANYTIMAWIKIVVDLNVTTSFLSLSTTAALNFDRAKFDNDGTTVGVSARNGATVVNSNGTNLTVEIWRHVTMRRAGVADLKLFLDTVQDAFSNTDVTGRAANDNLNIGRVHVNNLTIEPFDGEMAYLRIWTTDLSQAEMTIERTSPVARKTSGLYGDYPLADSVTAGDDISGNGNHLTVNGTITTGESTPGIVTGPSLFRGRNFLFFDDESVNRFEFWPVVSEAATHERSAAINASGSIESSAQFFSTLERAALTSAVGAIESSAQFFSTLERAVEVSSTGAIAASGARVVSRSISLDSSAAIQVSGLAFSVFESTALVSASGSVVVGGISFSVFENSAVLATTVAILSSGLRVVDRSISISVVGSVETTATFFTVVDAAVQINVTASIETASQFFTTFDRSTGLDTTALITVNGQTEQMRQAVLSALGSVAVAGVVIPPSAAEHERSADIASTVFIAATGLFFSIVQRSSATNVIASVAVTGQKESLRSVSLTAIVSISTSGELPQIEFRPVGFARVNREFRIQSISRESRVL